MGINGTMLEMLFVHPRAIGTGIGKQLMRYALEHCHVRYVDVNEQNKKASGFYGHFGFRVIGRDAKDASGEPYPILHLKLGGIMKIENWGLVPYSEAWKRQTELFNAVVEAKQVGKTYENRILSVMKNPFIHESARMDITEIAQIRIYIQRQSMHCHKMTASHSYCTNFPFLRSSRGQPYSGRSLHSPGLNAIRCADPDHRFFQHMNIFLQPQMIILQIQEWKGNEYAAGRGTIEDDWCQDRKSVV